MTAEDRSESKDYSFLRFIIVATLTVIAIALCILSPWIFYIAMVNLGLRGEPFTYFALAAFWSVFIVLVVLAAAVDWMKKRRKRE